MAESYGFFDAEELVGGEFDREYLAEQFANYFKLFIGNGVFASPTNQLKVVAGTGLQIILKRGWAFINGYWYYNDDDLEIPVPANVTAQTINSGVFVQFNSADRTIHTVIATGRTTVDRDAPYYELKLAELSIATGTTAISDAMITDTRTNENVCGFVKGLLEGVISTNDLFAQYTAIFNEWFDHMKDQLSEDAAGNLQNEIDAINAQLRAHDKDFQFSYDETSGKYGYTIDGTFYPFRTTHTLTKAITASTSKITTDMGVDHDYRYVEVSPTPSQAKSVGWSVSAQTVTPDSGKLLSSVSVGATPDARNSSKVGTLTSADGRRVHSLRELWRVVNSDGVVRTCLELPASGYYENQDIIGATDAQMRTLGWRINTPSYSSHSPTTVYDWQQWMSSSAGNHTAFWVRATPSVSKSGNTIYVTVPITVRQYPRTGAIDPVDNNVDIVVALDNTY